MKQQSVQSSFWFFLVIVGLLIGIFWLILKLIICFLQPKYTDKHIIILLGSGGHTTQMCLLMKDFQFEKINCISVVLAKTDNSSKSYFIKFLQQKYLQKTSQITSKIQFIRIERTNQVKQSKLTSGFTTLYSTLKVLILIFQKRLYKVSDLIGNGPGLCVPFYLIFFLLKKLKLVQTKLIFFQSWCRVESLSLTGKIVKRLADVFIVHWKQLADKYPGTQFRGKLI